MPSQEPLASPPKPPPAIEGEPSPGAGRPRRKPAAEAAAPPPDPAAAPAFDAGALLAGDLETLPARFGDLVGEQIAAEARAVIDARAVASETSAEAERAALDVPPAERALLRDRTDAAHATLDAARARAARAKETAELARRELGVCEQALAAAQLGRACGQPTAPLDGAGLEPDDHQGDARACLAMITRQATRGDHHHDCADDHQGEAGGTCVAIISMQMPRPGASCSKPGGNLRNW